MRLGAGFAVLPVRQLGRPTRETPNSGFDLLPTAPVAEGAGADESPRRK